MANGQIASPVAPLQTPLVDVSNGLIGRNWYPFFTVIQNLLASAYLPIINASDYGADPTGLRDSSGPLMAAYSAAVNRGGGIIYIGPGQYNIYAPIVLNAQAPVTFMGAGRATKIVRGTNMPAGQGVWDLQAASYITFQDFNQDGAVTSPAGVLYSEINGDPLSPILTQNTSFWIKDGCSNITFNNVIISHTGGYSVLVQAVLQNITDLYFDHLQLENNRPHLFGTTAGDLNYGSWTGGVLLHADGVSGTGTVSRAEFLSCSAIRCTGTAFWAGHVYSFNVMFDGIRFQEMYFEDCGRDLIQLGATLGCRINGVTGRRVGYITTDDTSVSVPRWQTDEWAVAIDCGPCFGTVIDNVNLTSVNGGGVDLDGMAYTTLSNFSIRNPLPGEPEYDTDQLGLIGFAGSTSPGGPNAAYGILEAPAGYGPFMEGAHRVSAGNIINMSAGALRLYGAHNSAYSDIRIWHPYPNSGAPVQIGNISASERSMNLTVSNLHIEYSPSPAAPCIVETGGAAPFQGTDVNQYLMNQVVSSTGATAVQTDAASGSVASFTGTLTSPTTLTFTDGSLTGHT